MGPVGQHTKFRISNWDISITAYMTTITKEEFGEHNTVAIQESSILALLESMLRSFLNTYMMFVHASKNLFPVLTTTFPGSFSTLWTGNAFAHVEQNVAPSMVGAMAVLALSRVESQSVSCVVLSRNQTKAQHPRLFLSITLSWFAFSLSLVGTWVLKFVVVCR